MINDVSEYNRVYNKSICGHTTYDTRTNPIYRYLDFKQALANPVQYSHDKCLNSPLDLRRHLLESERNVTYATEALIKTYPVEYLIKSFKAWFKTNVDKDLQDLTFADIVNPHGRTDELNDNFNVGLCDIAEHSDPSREFGGLTTFYVPFHLHNQPHLEQILQELTKGLYRCGYNIAHANAIGFDQSEMKMPDVGVMYVTFEPRFNEQSFEYSPYLYHVTTTDELHKIAKNGLVPKSKHSFFRYEDRVYLFNNYKFTDIIEYGLDKAMHKGSSEIAVLRIDSAKLKADSKFKTGKIQFYADGKYSMVDDKPIAIYTYNNVDRGFIDDDIMIIEMTGAFATSKKFDQLSRY